MPVVPPLQKVSVAGVAVTSGVGFTVTKKWKSGPTQPVDPGPLGVMIYSTTPVDLPVLTRVWFIGIEQLGGQSLNPVIVPPVGAVDIEAIQVKVVPATAEVGV
jgi:hypothetical protein